MDLIKLGVGDVDHLYLHRELHDRPQRSNLSKQHRLKVLEGGRFLILVPESVELELVDLCTELLEHFGEVDADLDHHLIEPVLQLFDLLFGGLRRLAHPLLIVLLAFREVIFVLGELVVDDELLLVGKDDHELLQEVEDELTSSEAIDLAKALQGLVVDIVDVLHHVL